MSATSDPDQIRQALAILFTPGDVVELRVLEASTARYRRPHIESGYFNDWDKLVEAALSISRAKGWYVTINPVNPELLARAANHVRPVNREPTTSDRDISRRRWLPIDFNAERAAGISATSAEHEAALARAMYVRDQLAAADWPQSIVADSGNGGHLLYRVDLPADDGGLIERCLKSLASQFPVENGIKIDIGNHNPARIWKLYGTVACKGDSMPERPHRLAKLLHVPEVMKCSQ